MITLFDPLEPIDVEYEEVSHNESYEKALGVDMSFFKSDKAVITPADDGVTAADTKNTRGPRKKRDKDNTIVIANAEIVENTTGSVYDQVFDDTNRELKKAIAQADILSNEIKEDIDRIRSSSTIKNKYTYITNLTASASALIGTKIQAIRELNNSKSNAIKMDLDRQKVFKEANKQNDEMRIMDLYNSFVNAPIGSYNPNPLPSLKDITMAANGGAEGNFDFVGVDINQAPEEMTQRQITMRASEDRSIKTVVRYNAETGMRTFDVINVNTGESVSGVERPDSFLLNDTIIDIHNKVAKNRNIGTNWELVIDGNTAIDEY